MSQQIGLSITLKSPVVTGKPITQATIDVERNVPAGAAFKVELTNNGNDSIPVWENATEAVLNDRHYIFVNNQAANGYAFNLRITANRGASGKSVCVGKIRGAIGTDTAMTLLKSIRAGLRIDDMRDKIAEIDEAFSRSAAAVTASVARLYSVLGGVPLDVTARLVAMREGKGKPSPDNVRAIVGRDTVTVVRASKNILDIVNKKGTEAYGTRALISNGFRLTATARQNVSSTYHLPLSLLGESVTLSFDWATNGDAANQRVWFHFGAGSNGNISAFSQTPLTSTHTTITAEIPAALPEGAEWLAVRFYSNYSNAAVTVGSYTEFTNIQLELGSTSTEYEPYVGQSYAITLPETLYGLNGAEDEARSNGAHVKRTLLYTCTGAEDWAARPSGAGYQLANAGQKDGGIVECSHYSASITTAYLQLSDTHYEKAGDFKAHLAAQYASGNPVQILYELETPQIIPIPPVIIPSLHGENALYSDGGGNITVVRRMDVQPAFETLQAQITALRALLIQS